MSPFSVQAAAGVCQSQPLSTMAYSIDSGRDTMVKSSTIAVQLAAAPGVHTLHVKSWGTGGALCQQAININILDKLPAIPANVAATASIQGMTTWTGEHDAATTGSSTGTTSLLTGASN